jgi:two-component system OmpR family sensor kinase
LPRTHASASEELLRLRRLSNRLLLLASADSPEFLALAPVEVEDLLSDALKRWVHTPRAWSLRVPKVATVEADLDRLALALDALIENAIGHTEVSGRIELSADLQGRSVVLAVADSGPGISARDLDRIFDRFARTDSHRSREAGGFGLGLSIVKAVAEAHHGSVQVRSTEGKGSIFEMVLPTSLQPGGRHLLSHPGYARAPAHRIANR